MTNDTQMPRNADALFPASQIFWLPSLVFILHTLEELPQFASWSTQHFGPLSPELFSGTHIPMILLVIYASYRASAAVSRSAWMMVAAAFQWQFGLNAIFHLTTWVMFAEYSPGMVTAATVQLPATWYFFSRMRREGRLSRGGTLGALALGTVIAICAIGVLFLH